MICKVCKKSIGFKTDFLDLKDGYSYLTCLNCYSGILDPFPKPQKFQEKYNTEEYYDDLSRKTKNKMFDFLLNLRIYELPSEFTLGFEIKKGNALDVGCGNGEFLASLKKAGYLVFGTDLSKIALERTRVKLKENKNNFYKGDFSQIDFPNKFNLISFWHVLEHVENPSDYLKKSYSLLNKEGIIVGEVPNYNSLVFKIFKNNYNWIMIPEHIIYFSPKSLELVLKTLGFRDIIIYNPNRAVTNLTGSIVKSLEKLNLNSKLTKVIYFSSLFLTIPLMIVFSFFNRGEVLRFYAKK